MPRIPNLYGRSLCSYELESRAVGSGVKARRVNDLGFKVWGFLVATINFSQIIDGHGFLLGIILGHILNPKPYETTRGTPVSTLNGPLVTLMLTVAHILKKLPQPRNNALPNARDL